MVHASLHMICGCCGCKDQFEYKIVDDLKDFGDRFEEGVLIHCRNCCTNHDLDDNATYKLKLNEVE